MEIEIRRTDSPRPVPEGSLGFGRVFTDHVFRMCWEPDRGWTDARIEPYGPVSMDPAASVLHYAQSIFEGLKAFRGADDRIRLFRPDRHARRFVKSAEVLCIPPLPEEVFVESVEKLVEMEARWVPGADGSALYLRPIVFATEPFLGVRPAQRYEYVVLACPVGAYYAKGFAPVKIWVERERVRVAKGGLGTAKTGGNYAASLLAAEAAKKRGYAQVLWTDAVEHEWIEEVGTMNVFVHLQDEVATPPLDGSILDGVTRDSVITLLRERGVAVRERPVSVTEVRAAHTAGALHEIFGTGTAAVVSPVSALGLGGQDLPIGDGTAGPLARSLFDEVVGIQRGAREDRHGWCRVVGDG